MRGSHKDRERERVFDKTGRVFDKTENVSFRDKRERERECVCLTELGTYLSGTNEKERESKCLTELGMYHSGTNDPPLHPAIWMYIF